MFKRARQINQDFFELMSEELHLEDIETKPIKCVRMQDEHLLNLEYIETLFKSEKYPDDLNQQSLMDCMTRLNHVAFEINFPIVQRYFYDQIHYSNLFKIQIESLVCSLRKKGKSKQELFRDNSVHLKAIKRYFSCICNSFREQLMDKPLEKIIKAFKNFNPTDTMNESKSAPIRDAIVEGYEYVLANLNKMPDSLLDCICTIYECTNHYYYEEDDPSSTARIK